MLNWKPVYESLRAKLFGVAGIASADWNRLLIEKRFDPLWGMIKEAKSNSREIDEPSADPYHSSSADEPDLHLLPANSKSRQRMSCQPHPKEKKDANESNLRRQSTSNDADLMQIESRMQRIEADQLLLAGAVILAAGRSIEDSFPQNLVNQVATCCKVGPDHLKMFAGVIFQFC